MKITNTYKSSLLAIVCFCFTLSGFAQAQWEVDMVKEINPRYPSDNTWKSFSSTTKPVVIAVPFCMLAISLINDNKKLENNAYEVAAGIALAAVATGGLKLFIKRPRPYETYPTDIYPDAVDNSPSFPSGHTSIAFAAATSLTLTTKKWYVAMPAFAWASGVAYSRVYLGQHYPSDVIAGAFVGAAGAYAAHWLKKKFLLKRKSNRLKIATD